MMMQSLHMEERISLRKRILIVDDYSPTRQLITDALNQLGHYEINEAENGREALAMCVQNPFDLVISDVMMPGGGGMELLSKLKEMTPDTSVIMITAQPAVELTVSAMKKGAVDFLKKPFNIDDLLYKVQICLFEKKLMGEDRPRMNNVEVKIKNKTKELSVKGFIYDSFEKFEGDNEYIFKKLVDLSLNVVDGEECALLLFDQEAGMFHPKIIKSQNREAYEHETIPVLQGIFRQVVEKKTSLMIHSSEHPQIAPSLICAPLMIRNNVFGIICIRKKTNREQFTKKDLDYIGSLTKRASLNLENQILYESVYNSVLDTFQSLIDSIQIRDHYTEEHCNRTTKISLKIAEGMQCTESEIEALKIAGMLHDVGKIAIPDSVLLKPGKLTSEEFTIIKTHSEVGDRILKPLFLFDRERHIILHHHERWDGKGYPGGLSGTDIPFLARILAVADSFDAMTSTRPYRPAMSIDTAVEELKKNRNLQFDKNIIDAFLTLQHHNDFCIHKPD
jgi:response regulator RpfG family c-di-GMP phosphodiesterase